MVLKGREKHTLEVPESITNCIGTPAAAHLDVEFVQRLLIGHGVVSLIRKYDVIFDKASSLLNARMTTCYIYTINYLYDRI